MTKPNVESPTLEVFEQALQNVRAVAIETPVLHSHYLSALTGQEIFLKAENLQRTGAYKLRGAYNRMSKLTAAERKKGVVAASAGNHAQGVALAAKKLGIKATIFMPVGASLPKFQATQNYGAQVVLEGAVFAETLKAAQEYAAKKGAIFIPPYDHLDVIAGQGTVGLEVVQQVPDVKTILVAIGGGGLAAGVAVAAKLAAAKQGRKIQVIGVQSENAASYVPSLKKGTPTQIHTSPTIADGIAVSKPGAIPFALIAKHLDKVVTVNDNQIATAIVALLERSKLVVEPAGAVAVAALMTGKVKPRGTTVAVLSGGNIDPLLLQKVIGHGLEAAERYTTVTVMLPDRPGQLVKTADAIAKAHGNVVEVLHTRHGKGLDISEVELQMSVETMGHEHRQRVFEALNAAGLKVKK
ncbi:threonine ammonia-lyase [Candidatus Rhodoluna planktonica]|uniref:L-threonine dehydratase catabolic TdcB n=1 Tax=Candidatus Rhodoluna planktonica TaxID=535712 RepID=A0A1D9DY85_9MICO|nr:threonine ammonia-lyase [Candidatus Rhodoluna planktonica]AOY55778.1 threonine ammonia-lyase [Candidatus Rhodoluna planktonica]